MTSFSALASADFLASNASFAAEIYSAASTKSDFSYSFIFASKAAISVFKTSIFFSASDFGALPSGLFGTEGASPSFKPPVN